MALIGRSGCTKSSRSMPWPAFLPHCAARQMVAISSSSAPERRAVRRSVDWREHHGLGLVLVHREPGEEPLSFDTADLGHLADNDRIR